MRLRRVLTWAGVVLALLAVAVVAVGCSLYQDAKTSNVGELQFRNPLAIPPLLEPRDEDGRKVFELTLQQGRTELLPGRMAETWGANGSYLGPTVRASRGDRVEVRVRNELPEATTIHWHGMHLPAIADGGPHQTIDPGAEWRPSWTIEQPAATLWYHPHPHGETANHVYRGIAGLFLLDDAESAALPLPHRYGVDDVPLIIQDKRIHADGSLDFSQSWISPTGRLGDRILVNGTFDPHLEVADTRVRFRLLNASNARVYAIGFADGRTFDLIATEGGLLERPVRLDRIQLSPAERAEIVVGFKPGERVVMRSFEPELGAGFFEERFAGGDDTFDLLEVRAEATLRPSPEVPARLAASTAPPTGTPVATRSFELQGQRAINGRSHDLERIDEVVEAGSVEVWEVRNADGMPHNFHPHGVSFRVLDVDGATPPAHLEGWKDTVFVAPGTTVRLLVPFPDHPDAETPYMYHCHLLQHEDRGMMGQFVLVAPGERPPGMGGHDHAAHAGTHEAAGARGTLRKTASARPPAFGTVAPLRNDDEFRVLAASHVQTHPYEEGRGR